MIPPLDSQAAWLPLAWSGVIAFGIIMYVLLDGFDLGIGILYPTAYDEVERDLMMNTVAPVWDGNETWLVLGGVALLAAFPLAYATVLPALYLPLVLMLIALVFRGVAFEFRFRAGRSKALWSHAFFWGSLLATFAQGLVLGAYVQGIEVEDRAFAGGPLDWFSPFSLVVGLALIAGYALLGATWLVMKTEGPLQARMRRRAEALLAAVLFFIAVVSLWVPLSDPTIAARWFSWPNIAWLSPVPLAVLLTAVALFAALRRRHDRWPFVFAMALFLLGFLGLGISLWPKIVPPEVTIWDAAAAPASQRFLLVGVVILLPIILGYSFHSYRVFRGKVREGEGYH